MRYIPIEEVGIGDVLAKPVYDLNGMKLVDIETPLTDYILSRLKQYEITGLYVNDEKYEDIYVEELISQETISAATKALKSMNIDAALRVSDKIVDELLEDDSVIYDLMDIRTYCDYTYKHSLNVSVLSTIVGIGLGYNRTKLKELAWAGLLHDIGKFRISKSILNKPAKLTPKEYEIMKKHSAYSYEMIKDLQEIPATVKAAVYLHHENEDGSGYPLGIGKNEIFEFAKIIHITDVYDALVNKRSYKDAYSPLEATEYLMGKCNSMFSMDIVKVFLKYVAVYPKGTDVWLSDGRKGVVYYNYSDFILRPDVKVDSGEVVSLRKELNITIV